MSLAEIVLAVVALYEAATVGLMAHPTTGSDHS